MRIEYAHYGRDAIKVRRQRRLQLPPAMPAMPAMLQLEGMTPRSEDEAIVPPFMNQITVSPFVFLQRMPVVPSPPNRGELRA